MPVHIANPSSVSRPIPGGRASPARITREQLIRDKVSLPLRRLGQQCHVTTCEEPVKVAVAVDELVDEHGIRRRRGERLLEALVGRSDQGEKELLAVSLQPSEDLVDRICFPG